jgi:hypothetical protein
MARRDETRRDVRKLQVGNAKQVKYNMICVVQEYAYKITKSLNKNYKDTNESNSEANGFNISKNCGSVTIKRLNYRQKQRNVSYTVNI